MDGTTRYLDLEIEEEGEKELTLEDETTRYLELVIEDVTNVIDTGGGGKPVSDALALIEGTITSADYPKATKIRANAFCECSSLTSVNFPEVTTIDDYSFAACPLTSLNFPKVTSLGEEVFAETLVKEIYQSDFPSLTKIDDQAFKGMTELARVDFSNITSIGEKAFNKCSSLMTLILRNSKVVTLEGEEEWFADTPIEAGTGYIYVPDDLVENYKTATNWSTYADQIKPLSELPA